MASSLARELIPSANIVASFTGVKDPSGNQIGKLEVLPKDINFIGHIIVSGASVATKEITSITAIAAGGVKEITDILVVADVSDSLDGKYFILQDDAGSVAFWIDTDNSGTTIPGGAAAADRAIEITTIATDDAIGTVGTKVYTAIIADSKFEAGTDDAAGTLTIQSATYGLRTNGADGDTGFTIGENTSGAGLDATYFILQDEVGSVAFWIDLDNSGTVEPSGAAAADRSVEITTVTNAMNAAQVGDVIYTAVIGDSKFEAGSDAASPIVLVQSTTTGIKTDGADGDTGFTIAEDTAGDEVAAYAAKIQHSHNGSNWFDLLSFSAISVNTSELVVVDNTNDHVTKFIRVVITKTTGDATFVIDLLYDRR